MFARQGNLENRLARQEHAGCAGMTSIENGHVTLPTDLFHVHRSVGEPKCLGTKSVLYRRFDAIAGDDRRQL